MTIKDPSRCRMKLAFACDKLGVLKIVIFKTAVPEKWSCPNPLEPRKF